MFPDPLPCVTEELNFLHAGNCSFNQTVEWPCEVRAYWVQIQPFVSSVRFLLTYVTAFIIVLGLTMNTLSFLVLNSSPLRHTSLSVFLRALAVSDNGALIFNFATGLGRGQLPQFSKLFMNNEWLCGANKVLMDVFLFYSTWLVVGVTMKRLLVVSRPLNHNFKFTVRQAKFAVVAIGFVSLCLASLKLQYSGDLISGYEQDSTFGYEPCSYDPGISNKVVYIYVALSTWLPCLFIFIGNALLIREVRKSNKTRIQLSGDRTVVRQWNETHRMLGMLLTVSLSCLLLMLPLGVVETFELYWNVVLFKAPSSPEAARQHCILWQQEKLLLKWIRGFFFWLYQWNFATNFFLYCLTGRKFRTAARQYLQRYLTCRWCYRPVNNLRHRIIKDTRSSRPTETIVIELDEHKSEVIAK